MRSVRSAVALPTLCLAVSVVLALAALAFLSGCGSTSTSSSKSSIATYLYPRPPVTDWDPDIEAVDGAIVLQNVYETLLRYEPSTDSFTPLLATSYAKSSDGKTWTFKIRQGVKFHDGTTLDAQAVKFSIERCIKVNKGVSYIWAPVDSIETPDSSTVVVKLKYPAPLDLIVSSNLGAYIMSPTAVKSHPGGWLTAGHEAGTGPYMLKSQKMQQEVVLTKFPDYWRGWSGSHFDDIVIQRVSESTTRRQMIEGGEADIVTELPSEDFKALEGNASLQVNVSPSYRNLEIALNTRKKPCSDPRVRQALAYLYPYGDAVQSAAGGYAVQARGPVPAGLWGHSDQVFQYTFNPVLAKQLLAQAGYANGGFSLQGVYTSGDELERRCMELYKAELAKVGINLQLRGGPWESIWENAKSTSAPQDMFIMYWYPTYCDPYDFLFNLYHTETQPLWNLSYWYDPQFDSLIDKASRVSAVDRKSAAAMYVQAQNIAQQAVPWICLLDKRNVVAVTKSFTGFKDNAAYQDVVFFYDCSRQ